MVARTAPQRESAGPLAAFIGVGGEKRDVLEIDRGAAVRETDAQGAEDYINGTPKLGGGVPDVLPDDAPKFLRDYYDY